MISLCSAVSSLQDWVSLRASAGIVVDFGIEWSCVCRGGVALAMD